MSVTVVPARLDWLEALVEGDGVFTERFGIAVIEDWAGFPEAVPRCRDAARERDEDPWGTHLFFDAQDGALVGLGGWKGEPVDGVAEFGYAIAPERQGRGLATAVVTQFLARGADAGLQVAIAHTLAETNASTAVLTKNGLVRGADVVDFQRGTIWRWERRLTP